MAASKVTTEMAGRLVTKVCRALGRSDINCFACDRVDACTARVTAILQRYRGRAAGNPDGQGEEEVEIDIERAVRAASG